MTQAPEQEESERFAVYILGAGFSAAAGLPLANDLWKEVCRRGLTMDGRAAHFRRDLDKYIEFKRLCAGVKLTYKTVNFEEFLGYLDVEHYLGLRGSDTWSADGNESQIVVKVLIGQILAERTLSVGGIPPLYRAFASKLLPGDTVITFNYDLLMERACEAARIPYRLAQFRYVSTDSGMKFSMDWPHNEVAVIKLHGSLDWFDKSAYIAHLDYAFNSGVPPNKINDCVPDPVFNSSTIRTVPLIEPPRLADDPMRDMHRVVNIDEFYKTPPWFRATPAIINPSTQKIIYASKFRDFWLGRGRDGGRSLRMVIIGYSLPTHDEYTHQVIYNMVRNYQGIPSGRKPRTQGKENLRIVDFRRKKSARDGLLERYAFVDWNNASVSFDGFNEAFVAGLG